MWKKNIMEELESGEMEYETAEEFFTNLRREFGGEEEESVKVAELRKLEQGGKTLEEFVLEFKRAARGSGYKCYDSRFKVFKSRNNSCIGVT